MIVSELRQKLAAFRDTDEVMIHDGKLLLEAHRGSLVQQSAEGDEMGCGTASEWLDMGVPAH
jgi:hypothetical protein